MMAVGGLMTIVGVVALIGGGGDETATSTTLPEAVASTTTVAPTTSSTTSTTQPPTTTTTVAVAETPEEFLVQLVEGLRENPEFLVSRLNLATIEIYGTEQCLSTLRQVLDPETELEIREIGEVGPWDYVIDDVVTPLENVLAVEVQRLVGGETRIQELHWQLVDGVWTWFSDCGEPLGS